MGRKRRRKNATYRKQFFKLQEEQWAKESRQRMRLLVGADPNAVRDVHGTVDGRDWRTFFSQPLKYSGFSWFEFARRVESLQAEKNEQQRQQMRVYKQSLKSHITVDQHSKQTLNVNELKDDQNQKQRKHFKDHQMIDNEQNLNPYKVRFLCFYIIHIVFIAFFFENKDCKFQFG